MGSDIITLKNASGWADVKVEAFWDKKLNEDDVYGKTGFTSITIESGDQSIPIDLVTFIKMVEWLWNLGMDFGKLVTLGFNAPSPLKKGST
jgi:hypothetical protein